MSNSRRLVLSRSATLIAAASTGLLLPEIVRAQGAKVRVGLMLPYTGTFAQLGVAIENGMRMAIDEQGGKLGGREIEWFKVDDESDPSKGVENATKLVQRDKVDVLIGTVHSGVQMGILKVARDTGVLSLIPNAGVHAATRALCAPNVFRTSFTNSQPTLALGKVLMDKGLKKAVWITWKYAAGDEAFEGFKESYTKAGGTIVKELGLPFPNVEFQALLTEIAALKPDVVVCFFAGGGAAKFIRDYAAAGLKGKIPLYGSGFLTEGVLDAAGPAADGIVTTMHYSDSLDTPRNKQFRLAYAKDVQEPARRVRRAGLRHRPAAGAGRQRRQGRLQRQARALQSHGGRRHRQPARQVDHEQGAQPGAGHLPARGREQGKQGDRYRGQGAVRFGRRLQDGLRPAQQGSCGTEAADFLRRFSCHPPMDFANLLIQILNSVQYGLLLFMLAAGLTLIFGIMGVVNLAHGSFSPTLSNTCCSTACCCSCWPPA